MSTNKKEYTPGFEDVERIFDLLEKQRKEEARAQWLKKYNLEKKGGEQMRITVDPNTDSSGFGYAEAGQYRLRVVECEQKEGTNYPYVKWELEFVDANVKATDGKSKVGHVFENTTLKSGENAQFGLKRVCDALGIEWGDFDTEEVKGLELDAHLGVKEYEGNFSNTVKKFIPVK